MTVCRRNYFVRSIELTIVVWLLIVSTFSILGVTHNTPHLKPSASAAADLPMLFRGSQPAVEVMVNGQGPFLFAIDTGATDEARVDSSLVARLELRVSGTSTHSDGSNKKTKLGIVRLDSLSVGGLEFRNVKAATRDYNRLNLPHIDGILAFDLFHGHLLTLDYPAKCVRFWRGELPAVDGGEVLPLKRVHSHPAVELTIGSRKVAAEIDSGNVAHSFLFPASLVERLSLATEPTSIGKAKTITNELEIMEAQLRDNVRLGKYEFTQPLISFPAPFPFANIGNRFLNQFAITFDQKNNRVRFVRPGNDKRNSTGTQQQFGNQGAESVRD